MVKTTYFRGLMVLLVLLLTVLSVAFAASSTAPEFTNTSAIGSTVFGSQLNDSLTLVHLAVITNDPNNDSLTYDITAQTNDNITCTFLADNATVSCQLVGREFNAISTVTLEVSDGNETVSADGVMSFLNNNINNAPELTVPSSEFNTTRTNVTQGVPFVVIANLDTNTTDLDGDVLTYDVLSQTNTNISCSFSGVSLSCTLVGSVTNATTTLVLTLDDGFNTTVTGDVNVSIIDANHPPTFTTFGFIDSATIFQNFTPVSGVSTLASDVDGDTISIVILDQSDPVNVPCTLDLGNDTLNCVYAVGSDWNVFSNITLGLDDGNGGVSNGTITITLNNTNQPPYFTSGAFLNFTVFSGATVGEVYTAHPNITADIVDPNNDTVTVTLVAESNPNVDCSLVGVKLSCALTGSVVNVSSVLTLTLDDGNGALVNDSFYVSFLNNDVLEITNITTNPTLTTTVTEGNSIAVNFTSNLFPLNVTIEMIDGSGNVVGSVTQEVMNASGLPVSYTTSAGSDGTHTLNLTASTSTKTVEYVVGSFTFDDTSNNGGGGSSSSRNRGSSGSGPFTVVNTTEDEPIVIDEVVPAPVDVTPQVVVEPEGTLISEENATGNEVSGEFTGSDEPSSLAWLWWLLALFVAAILIWELSGKRK